MKVLVMYCNEFTYTPAVKNLNEANEVKVGETRRNCILAFVQIESEDEIFDVKSREKKLTNHLKWTSRKNNTNSIVLHSFAHLSNSKASIKFSKEIFEKTQKRLEYSNYEVLQTPWGYFLDLKIDAPGYSLARIWTSL